MKELFKSLANFQQECPVIQKNTQGYGYRFADLPTIFEVINPLLKKHGLGFTQLIGSGTIKTIVFHIETGQQLESETSIPENVSLKGMNEFQVLGSAITYIRRYAISSALGLVTDVDNDASGEQQPKTQTQAAKQSIQQGSETWKKAVKFIKEGGDINAIVKKYALTESEQEKLIENANRV